VGRLRPFARLHQKFSGLAPLFLRLLLPGDRSRSSRFRQSRGMNRSGESFSLLLQDGDETQVRACSTVEPSHDEFAVATNLSQCDDKLDFQSDETGASKHLRSSKRVGAWTYRGSLSSARHRSEQFHRLGVRILRNTIRAMVSSCVTCWHPW